MSNPHVVIIVLNTNRRDDTLECLGSIQRSDYADLSVVVLDNASTDGSVEAIQLQFPWVEILPLSDNRGYAGNNNVGIELAVSRGAEWVFVLNEDTVLAPDCISKLIATGDSHPQIGMIGPLVYHYDEPEVIQSAGVVLGRYLHSTHLGQNEMDTGQFTGWQEVEAITGCSLCVRSDVIREIGALDERFFYYWEETDWCLRARQAGWLNAVEPAAKLWHKGVQRDYRPKPSVAYYNTRNRLLTLSKQRVPPDVWITVYGEMLRTLVIMSVRPKWRNHLQHRDALWRGLVDFHQHNWGRGRV